MKDGSRIHGDRMVAFAHIPKTGGHTVRHVLQQNFGLHHVDPVHSVDSSDLASEIPGNEHFPLRCIQADPPQVYRADDLRADLRLHPSIWSFSSHLVVPFVNFGSYEERLTWFSMFRQPVGRFLSHYQMNQGNREEPMDLFDWADRLPLRNQQTHWIAGREDVDAAKEILDEKFVAVGLVEKFDRSLLMLREFACGEDFVPSYRLEKNTAKDTSLKDHVRENWDEYEEVVREYNELDDELYTYVRDELWPQQVEAYGEAQLEADERRFFEGDGELTVRHQLNRMANAGYRRLVYQPVANALGRN